MLMKVPLIWCLAVGCFYSDAVEEDIDDLTGGGLGVEVAGGEDGGAEKLIDGAEQAMSYDAIRDVAPEDALLLAATDDLADDADVADK